MTTSPPPVPGPPPDLDLSVIVPAFNEEENLGPLYASLRAELENLGLVFEILFVDDGSRDRTFERMAALAEGDHRVRVIKLRRNYGQTPAMLAGIDHARGAVLVTMDADLQNDPADIGRLVQELDRGYDMVAGWRERRHDRFLSRRVPSLIANRLIALVTGVDIKDNGCTLKAFRSDLIKRVPLYADLHRFIPAMASLQGARIAQLGVRHHPRRFGESKYGLSRIYKVFFDLMTVKTLILFVRKPVSCFGGVALVSTLLSVSMMALSLHTAIANNSEVVVYMGVSFLFGALAISLALIGLLGYLVFRMQAVLDRPDPSGRPGASLPVSARGVGS